MGSRCRREAADKPIGPGRLNRASAPRGCPLAGSSSGGDIGDGQTQGFQAPNRAPRARLCRSGGSVWPSVGRRRARRTTQCGRGTPARSRRNEPPGRRATVSGGQHPAGLAPRRRWDGHLPDLPREDRAFPGSHPRLPSRFCRRPGRPDRLLHEVSCSQRCPHGRSRALDGSTPGAHNGRSDAGQALAEIPRRPFAAVHGLPRWGQRFRCRQFDPVEPRPRLCRGQRTQPPSRRSVPQPDPAQLQRALSTGRLAPQRSPAA